MKNNTGFIFLPFIFIVAMVVYFVTHPSYEQSLEAKYYYETHNYIKAYKLAKEAFEKDSYNKMAATLMAQSKIAMKYQKYNMQAQTYLKEIQQLNTTSLDEQKKAKIRMMCSIMVDSYKKLASSVVTDTELVEQSRQYYQEFGRLLNALN